MSPFLGTLLVVAVVDLVQPLVLTMEVQAVVDRVQDQDLQWELLVLPIVEVAAEQ